MSSLTSKLVDLVNSPTFIFLFLAVLFGNLAGYLGTRHSEPDCTVGLQAAATGTAGVYVRSSK